MGSSSKRPADTTVAPKTPILPDPIPPDGDGTPPPEEEFRFELEDPTPDGLVAAAGLSIVAVPQGARVAIMHQASTLGWAPETVARRILAAGFGAVYQGNVIEATPRDQRVAVAMRRVVSGI